MNAGKLLFAQLMDFLPWTSFARSVARYGGDHRVRSLSLFPWAHFRSTKSAVTGVPSDRSSSLGWIKMHTLLDLRGSIPVFIRVTTGDMHDVNILDQIVFQPGAYYVVDRGYLDYCRLHRIHLAGAFFVTRAKSNLDASRIYSCQADK